MVLAILQGNYFSWHLGLTAPVRKWLGFKTDCIRRKQANTYYMQSNLVYGHSKRDTIKLKLHGIIYENYFLCVLVDNTVQSSRNFYGTIFYKNSEP